MMSNKGLRYLGHFLLLTGIALMVIGVILP